MSFFDLPADCLNHIAKSVVSVDELHPVFVRAREAAQLATCSKEFRTFTEQYIFPSLAEQCPQPLPPFPLTQGSWDTAEHFIPRLTISKLKPILRALGCKVSGRKAELVERALQACPKAGKYAKYTVEQKTRLETRQVFSMAMIEKYKLTHAVMQRPDGSYLTSFKDIIDAAQQKYGSVEALRKAEAVPVVPGHGRMCTCGAYHSTSDDEDDHMMYDTSSDDYDDMPFGGYGYGYHSDDVYDEDSEDDMSELQAMHLQQFMSAAMTNPFFFS